MGKVILLDLNYTLVSNSVETAKLPWAKRQNEERYRGWLIDLIKSMNPEAVVLITARPDYHREWTLQNIEKLTGWKPDMACFNHADLPPPRTKHKAMIEDVFPRYGSDPDKYLALESNLDTHAMYAKLGIKGLKVFPVSEASHEHDAPKQKSPALF